MSLDLTGRRALVTGASTGIGAAIASCLQRAGAAVVGVSRSGTSAETGVVGLAADLADADQLDTVVDRAVQELGGIDIVVNNAGRADWRSLGSVDRNVFDATMALNVWAPLRLCQLAHPYLSESGTSAVVMIGSVDATRPSAGGGIYGASKAALSALTIVLAKEWQDDGIRVTQVDPGLIDTPLAKVAVEAVRGGDHSVNLVGRVGTPEEVAGLVHYLVSPLGRFANATSFRVDGGALATGPFDLLAGD